MTTTQAIIKALQPVAYDKRTDVISPVGTPRNAEYRGFIYHAGYSIVEPVRGWGQYTHLIEVDDPDLGHGYYLAELA